MTIYRSLASHVASSIAVGVGGRVGKFTTRRVARMVGVKKKKQLRRIGNVGSVAGQLGTVALMVA